MPPGASARGTLFGAEGCADFGTENAFFSFFLPRPAPKDRIRPDSVCSMIRRPGDRREDRAECSGDFFGPRGRKPPDRREEREGGRDPSGPAGPLVRVRKFRRKGLGTAGRNRTNGRNDRLKGRIGTGERTAERAERAEEKRPGGSGGYLIILGKCPAGGGFRPPKKYHPGVFGVVFGNASDRVRRSRGRHSSMKSMLISRWKTSCSEIMVSVEARPWMCRMPSKIVRIKCSLSTQ